MDELKVRLERLGTMKTSHTHVLSKTPEEDAMRRIKDWAKRNGVISKETRLFGRNTWPTDNPEPHGYEFFLTIKKEIKPEKGIDQKTIPGGLYAVLRFTGLQKSEEAYGILGKWLEESKREYLGFRKEEHGWIYCYEEHVDWQRLEDKSPQKEWIFDLLIQLKE